MKNKKSIRVSNQLTINKFMPDSKRSISRSYFLNNYKLLKCKRSQIWVETAIYTLIGLTIITIILAIANPQIEKIKDRSAVMQARQALETLDNKISEVEQSIGSVSVPQIVIGKGKVIINATNDSIRFVLEDTNLEFSQIGTNIREGNFIVITDRHGTKFNVILTRYYKGINITYDGAERDIFLEPGAVPYKIRMENKGQNIADGRIIIDFKKI